MRSSASALAAAVLLASCAGTQRTAPARIAGYDEVGLATWYGEESAGHLTASGQPFEPAGMTAAHRTLPLGATAEVTDLTTGRRVLVVVNDRGPGDRSRLIDLSRGAAQALGTDRHPMARVRVRLVAGAPLPPSPSPYRQRLPSNELRQGVEGGPSIVQVAAFSSESRARALAEMLGGSVEPAGRVWRVRLGPFATRAQAERARDAAAARGYGDAAVLDAH